jgi:hypothetical protein
MIRQVEYVIRALPQGGKDKRNGVQSKEKVLTKVFFLNQIFKISVCCRNNNTVDGLGFSPPKTYDYLIIQVFQKLCL